MISFKNESQRLQIIDMLQENMNEEFRATLQYICHRISVYRRDSVLGESFKSAALDEMAHILYFSDMIDKIGGEPAFGAWPIDTSREITAMLKEDVALEQRARDRYARQLQSLEDQQAELRTIIQSVLSDEEDHADEFESYLKRYTKNA